MADDADFATANEAEHLARGLAAIVADVPIGVPGECDDCGEMMPRLVGGRCGFCRDGRRPPLSFFDADRAPPAIVAALAPAATETVMTTANTFEKQTISVPTEGTILLAIRHRAEERDLPLGRAVVSLVEDALAGEPIRQAPPALCDIAIDALLEELRSRIEAGADPAELTTALGRADVAERKLSALQDVLRG